MSSGQPGIEQRAEYPRTLRISLYNHALPWIAASAHRIWFRSLHVLNSSCRFQSSTDNLHTFRGRGILSIVRIVSVMTDA